MRQHTQPDESNCAGGPAANKRCTGLTVEAKAAVADGCQLPDAQQSSTNRHACNARAWAVYCTCASYGVRAAPHGSKALDRWGTRSRIWARKHAAALGGVCFHFLGEMGKRRMAGWSDDDTAVRHDDKPPVLNLIIVIKIPRKKQVPCHGGRGG